MKARITDDETKREATLYTANYSKSEMMKC